MRVVTDMDVNVHYWFTKELNYYGLSVEEKDAQSPTELSIDGFTNLVSRIFEAE